MNGSVKSRFGNVGQAASLAVHGASLPRVSGGKLPPELADKMAAPHLQTGSKSKINPSQLWTLIVVNALAGPTLGVSCYQWALKTTPTGVVLPIVAMTPIVIIPFARVMEGERPTLRSLIGAVIAVMGVVALTLVSRR